MVNSDTELKNAIEGLYQTFSRYPLSPHVAACPCCVGDKDHARLYSKGLRDLGPEDLARYSFKAMSTWGGTDDFRHFLPRIFELISDDSRAWIPQAVFGKLRYGDWETWRSDEQRAITTFFEALWSNALDHPSHTFSAEECLECIIQSGDDMTRYLDRWHIAQSPTHAKHFARFVTGNLRWSHRHGFFLDGVYWENQPARARQIVDWLRDPARKSELEQAFFNSASDQEDAALLSNALDHLAGFS